MSIIVVSANAPNQPNEGSVNVPTVEQVIALYHSILANMFHLFNACHVAPTSIVSIGKILVAAKMDGTQTMAEVEEIIKKTAEAEVKQIKLILLHQSILVTEEVQ